MNKSAMIAITALAMAGANDTQAASCMNMNGKFVARRIGDNVYVVTEYYSQNVPKFAFRSTRAFNGQGVISWDHWVVNEGTIDIELSDRNGFGKVVKVDLYGPAPDAAQCQAEAKAASAAAKARKGQVSATDTKAKADASVSHDAKTRSKGAPVCQRGTELYDGTIKTNSQAMIGRNDIDSIGDIIQYCAKGEKGEVRHGGFVRWHGTKKVLSGNYVEGKPDGVWSKWIIEGGRLRKEWDLTFTAGRPVLMVQFDEHGRPEKPVKFDANGRSEVMAFDASYVVLENVRVNDFGDVKFKAQEVDAPTDSDRLPAGTR